MSPPHLDGQTAAGKVIESNVNERVVGRRSVVDAEAYARHTDGRWEREARNASTCGHNRVSGARMHAVRTLSVHCDAAGLRSGPKHKRRAPKLHRRSERPFYRGARANDVSTLVYWNVGLPIDHPCWDALPPHLKHSPERL
jgi:hypothetical protein